MPTVPVRDAATVMVTRDGEAGLEVLLLKRSLSASFVGGAFVFPGGVVDAPDREAASIAACRGRAPDDADAALGAPDALSWWVAAVRECFEEAGLLLATGADGAPLRLGGEDAERFAVHRRAVHDGRRLFRDVLAEERLHIDAGAIHAWSRWITPVGSPRRYDARFFVAAAPADQVEVHDDHEMTESRWVRPLDALDGFDRGEILLILPTVKSLQALARFPSVAELLAAAGHAHPVPAILPSARGASTQSDRSMRSTRGPEP